jgi:hypothetical protein
MTRLLFGSEFSVTAAHRRGHRAKLTFVARMGYGPLRGGNVDRLVRGA